MGVPAASRTPPPDRKSRSRRHPRRRRLWADSSGSALARSRGGRHGEVLAREFGSVKSMGIMAPSEVLTNERRCQGHSSNERPTPNVPASCLPPMPHQVLASWIFGGLFSAFIIGVFIWAPPSLPEFKQQILAVICALLAGLFGVFLTGALLLNAELPIQGKWAVQGGLGFALFLIVLFWWRSPKAPVAIQDDPTKASVSYRNSVAPQPDTSAGNTASPQPNRASPQPDTSAGNSASPQPDTSAAISPQPGTSAGNSASPQPDKEVDVTWEPTYSPVGGYIKDCPCISHEQKGYKLIVTNSCPGPVPVLCFKDTVAGLPPDILLIVPSRFFAQTTLENGMKAQIDITGKAVRAGCQVYACPGTSLQPAAMVCRVPPPFPITCPVPVGVGINGQPCTCPDGRTGFMTQP
jgi:hypothetical protein